MIRIKRNTIGIVMLTVLMIFAISTEVYSQRGQGGPGWNQGQSGERGGRGWKQGNWQPPFFSELTEEQRAEIKELIQGLRDQDADRKTIRQAVHDKLTEWGIDFPKFPNVIERLGEQLTEEQKTELQTLIDGLKAEDADRKTIRSAVHEKLNEWGIERPAKDGKGRRGRMGRRLGHKKIFELLDDTQKEEIKDMVKGMRESGASRKEIREAVHAKLNEWGIELPEKAERGQGQNKSNNSLRGEGRIRGGNNPNPFNPETTISYELDSPGQVKVSVYNTQGQLIQTLENTYKDAGSHKVRWNGKSGTGLTVPSGMYVYKIEASGETFSGRMMLMK